MQFFSIHWIRAYVLAPVLGARGQSGRWTLTDMNNRSRWDLGSVRRDSFENSWVRSKPKAWCTPLMCSFSTF